MFARYGHNKSIPMSRVLSYVTAAPKEGDVIHQTVSLFIVVCPMCIHGSSSNSRALLPNMPTLRTRQ